MIIISDLGADVLKANSGSFVPLFLQIGNSNNNKYIICTMKYFLAAVI